MSEPPVSSSDSRVSTPSDLPTDPAFGPFLQFFFWRFYLFRRASNSTDLRTVDEVAGIIFTHVYPTGVSPGEQKQALAFWAALSEADDIQHYEANMRDAERRVPGTRDHGELRMQLFRQALFRAGYTTDNLLTPCVHAT